LKQNNPTRSSGWHWLAVLVDIVIVTKQEWSETDTGKGGGGGGVRDHHNTYGRIRIMSYLLCSAIDIAHQILHPITCSCENRNRDQHTLNPSPVFFGAPPKW
jgi:hypothetical protein